MRVGGRVLIFVWALEQTGKRDFDKDTQDVFVPWALAKKPTEKSSEPKKPKANSRPQGVKKKDRKNKTGDNVAAGQAATEQDEAKDNRENTAAGSVVTDALNKLTIQEDHTDSQGISSIKDNNLQDQSSTAADSLSSSSPHISIATTTTAAATTESNQSNPEDTPSAPEGAAPVYNRYYHLFHKGELEDLVLQTNKASIVQQGYDRDNWWCVLEKTRHE